MTTREGAEVPAAFVAVTVTSYDVPLVKPVIVHDVPVETVHVGSLADATADAV